MHLGLPRIVPFYICCPVQLLLVLPFSFSKEFWVEIIKDLVDLTATKFKDIVLVKEILKMRFFHAITKYSAMSAVGGRTALLGSCINSFIIGFNI